tara:strand:+ start:278 stop:427 length:150 start_codon:yes stop_codon:yes gene_type:complete
MAISHEIEISSKLPAPSARHSDANSDTLQVQRLIRAAEIVKGDYRPLLR